MDKKPISPTPFPPLPNPLLRGEGNPINIFCGEGGERLHHVQLLLSPPWKGGLGGSKRYANKARYPLTRGFTRRYTRKNCQDSPPLVGEGLGERFYLILSTNLSISHPTSHE